MTVSLYAVCVQFGAADSVVQLLDWTRGSLLYWSGNGTAYLPALPGTPHSLSHAGRFRLQLGRFSRAPLPPGVSGRDTSTVDREFFAVKTFSPVALAAKIKLAKIFCAYNTHSIFRHVVKIKRMNISSAKKYIPDLRYPIKHERT